MKMPAIGKNYNELFFLCIRQMEKVVLLFVHKQKQTKTVGKWLIYF